MSPSRRDFLSTATAATLTAVSLRGAAAPAASPPIVDTHVHLWDLTKFRLAWLEPGTPLHRNFLWEDYRQATQDLNLAKAIYMEVDVDPSQHEREATRWRRFAGAAARRW